MKVRPGAEIVLLTGALLLGASTVQAQPEPDLDHEDEMHFSHPLVTESPSPDSKVRLGYAFKSFDEDETRFRSSAIQVSAEHAWLRSFSIEFTLPFEVIDADSRPSVSSIGNIELSLKYLTFALEDRGLLFGSGLELGLPTGDDGKGIGSDHLVVFEPFLFTAFKRGRLEAVGIAEIGIPTNRNDGEAFEIEAGYNLSFLYHLSRRIQGLLEINGKMTPKGGEAGAVANLAPGLKLRPIASRPLLAGFGAILPFTSTKEFDLQLLFSLFYHFR